MDSFGLGKASVLSSREHGYDPFGSNETRQLLDQRCNYHLLSITMLHKAGLF